MQPRASRFTRYVLAAVGGALSLTACNSDHTPTGVNTLKPCASGTAQLAVLQAATVACAGGTGITLEGSGASYLVVPQFATGNVSNQLMPYTIGVANGAPTDLVAGGSPSLERSPASWRSPGIPPAARLRARQRAIDAMLMDRARRQVEAGDFATARVRPPAGIRATSVPPLNSTAQFHVLSSESPVRFTRVGARLEYVGQNILIYIDTLAPANGFTSDQLNAFGQIFDQTLYPIDTAAFGPPTDIDQNGHLIMLLSPAVNALTPANECGAGFVGGFFVGGDLGLTDTTSNRGEIFYSLVPDPNGTVSCPHSVAELEETTGATFLHELQHLINFGQHVIVHGGPAEFGWLDEGLSIVAEELGSLYYENRYPPPTGRKDPAQLFPDSSQGYINGLLFDSYSYLLKTDTATVTLHSDADGGLAWRGGDWLLVRWLGDQKGSGIFKALVQTNQIGTTNIANAAGESFAGLFGDFSLALYTDSLPGIPKSSIPVRNRFARRNLRQMYQRLFDTSQPSSDVPRPFPIVTTPLTSTISARMVPGTMSFYRLDTSTGQSTVTVQFSQSDGTPLATGLHPQVSIFRLP